MLKNIFLLFSAFVNNIFKLLDFVISASKHGLTFILLFSVTEMGIFVICNIFIPEQMLHVLRPYFPVSGWTSPS